MIYDAKTQKAARALAVKVQAAVKGVETFDAWAPIVIAAMRGCGGAVWQCFDDAGGNAHSWAREDFHKVRQVRNHPELFRDLYASISNVKFSRPLLPKRKA